ncbi:MAG: M48 family metalloprotease [Sphingopyxis sp.]
MSRRFSTLLAAALLAAAPAAAADPAPSPYAELAALEARVAAIAFRLTTASAAHCPVLQPQFGWLWGDPRLYDAGARSSARTAYNASNAHLPFLAAVAPGSPAATAGLRVGMAIRAANGVAVAPPEDDDPFARIAALESRLAALPPSTPAEIDAADGRRLAVQPVAGCISDFRVEARDRPSGAADGRLVLISAGLARAAADDDELAAVIAHELAHNILRHRARLDAADIDRGIGKQFGRNARLIRATEVEADRLSVWLTHAAGYAPEAAARFWTQFGKRRGPVLIQAGTHPRWKARVRTLETEVAALRDAEARGGPLDPPLIAAPPPLE